MTDWGRVAEDGTVYVITAAGERPVGSWHAGAPEQGLAHFQRRFEQMRTEVTLLEQRLRASAGATTSDAGQVARQVASSAERLKAAIPDAAAVGDLDSLERRVDALLASTAEAVEQAKAAKAEQRARTLEAKAQLAAEAEQLAGSSEWKGAGERLRGIGDDWKRLGFPDKKADKSAEDALWQRIADARKRFTERRTTHFAALEEQRGVSRARKEKIIAEAETVATSTDWKAGADRLKALMGDWKAAGRAPRDVEDTLWASFKDAQDRFFAARNEQFAAADVELKGNQEVKEAILAEAEQIDPAQGLEKAQRKLRALGERWEEAGKVPRAVMRSLEDRMAAVEQRVREAASTSYSKPVESTFTAKLRERVTELEGKLAKARAAGRPTDELEAALATQRQWLAQAGGASRSGGDGDRTGGEPAKPVKPRTTGWVRADA